MMGLARVWFLTLGVFVLIQTAPAGAQENLERGKTPAQLYASDCAICHKTPSGLSKAGGLFGLQGFLREHYTTSRETAAAIASYLSALDREAPPQQRGRATTTKRSPKSDKKPEVGDSKPGEAKPAQAKAPETKSSEPKASETKPAEATPAEPPRPVEAKPAEPKPAAEPGAKSE